MSGPIRRRGAGHEVRVWSWVGVQTEEFDAVVGADQEREPGGVGAYLGEVVAVGADEASEGGGQCWVIGAGEPVTEEGEQFAELDGVLTGHGRAPDDGGWVPPGERVVVAGGAGTVTNAAAGGTISVIRLIDWRQCGQVATARVLSPFATAALTAFAPFATS